MRERRRLLSGVVVSDKMDKTVVVQVERSFRHPLYGKVVRQRKKYMAHDEDNSCRVGDLVAIRESRPLSRRKRWVVERILKRAEEVPAVDESPAEPQLESNVSRFGDDSAAN